MNTRQRRGFALLACAAVGALSVLVAVSRYVDAVRAQVEPLGTVLELSRDVTAFEQVTPDMVTLVEVPQRWRPAAAITNTAALVGTVAAVDLPRGAVLQDGMLVARRPLHPGEREVTILVDVDAAGASGIGPGSAVDVYATFDGDHSRAPRSEIVVPAAPVVAVGSAGTTSGPAGAGFPGGQAVGVTFALDVADSLALAYAESFATAVRLGLVPARDTAPVPFDRRHFPPDARQADDREQTTEPPP